MKSEYIKGLVSVIIPCYNSEKYIVETVESILKQTYSNFEILLIDDVSNDETKTILENYSKSYKNIIVYFSNEKIYTSGGRNLGIRLAKGEYLAFVDSDDLWDENKLLKQVEFMEKYKISFTYTAVNRINGNGQLISKLDIPIELDYLNLLKGNKICCSSVLLNRDLLGDYYFNTEIKIVEDYALWLKILRENKIKAFGINEYLTKYRVHIEAKTRNKFVSAMDTWKVLRYSENLSLFRSMRAFFFYIIEGFRKYIHGL